MKHALASCIVWGGHQYGLKVISIGDDTNCMNARETNLIAALRLCPDTNAQGEMLRGIVFDQSQGDYGCYTTFDTNNGFAYGDEDYRRAFWAEFAFPVDLRWQNDPWNDGLDEDEIDEMARDGDGGQIIFADCVVHTCWHWEGDGTLAFMITDHDGNILCEYTNTDCKKSYTWGKYTSPSPEIGLV
jgi:hypothetical protein